VWRCDLHPDRSVFPDLIAAAGQLAGRGETGLVLLDTVTPDAATADASEAGFAPARWSFLAAEPFGIFRVREGRAFWNGAPLVDAPLAALRRLLDRHRLPPDPADPAPFRGGCAGYIAYDFGRTLERQIAPALPSGVDDVALGFYDVVVAMDHATGRVTVYSSGLLEDGAARLRRARERGENMRALLMEAVLTGGQSTGAASPEPAAGAARDASQGSRPFTFHASHDREAWGEAVRRVQAYIRAGDIFQANIARRFSASLPPGFDAFAFYRALRTENPAPFAAFMGFGDLAIASSSPERFLALRDGLVETRPIKGTARRSRDPDADAAAASALLASEKDRAENVMIVDLLRNDLSRVCAPHSVEVPALCALESYANVHHLTSVVRGRLAPGRDAVDLIAASFPGGSITGAPKIRAMDIITQIEGAARGVYCGAIGYIGFDGGMDLNIAIRTVAFQGGEAVFQAGGGITLLSDPQQEYDETEAKAARLFSAFACMGRAPCS